MRVFPKAASTLRICCIVQFQFPSLNWDYRYKFPIYSMHDISKRIDCTQWQYHLIGSKSIISTSIYSSSISSNRSYTVTKIWICIFTAITVIQWWRSCNSSIGSYRLSSSSSSSITSCCSSSISSCCSIWCRKLISFSSCIS